MAIRFLQPPGLIKERTWLKIVGAWRPTLTVWTREVVLEEFDSTEPVVTPAVHDVINRSLAVARRHRERHSLYGPGGSIAPEVIADLGAVGYWGLRANAAHAGARANLLVQFIRDMTAVDPWVAG